MRKLRSWKKLTGRFKRSDSLTVERDRTSGVVIMWSIRTVFSSSKVHSGGRPRDSPATSSPVYFSFLYFSRSRLMLTLLKFCAGVKHARVVCIFVATRHETLTRPVAQTSDTRVDRPGHPGGYSVGNITNLPLPLFFSFFFSYKTPDPFLCRFR